jgi:hypothetical protein
VLARILFRYLRAYRWPLLALIVFQIPSPMAQL